MTIDLSQLILAGDKAAQALTDARNAAQAALLARIEAVAAGVTGAVPLAEMLSWAAKEEAARAHAEARATAGQAALITGEAAVTGEDTAALVARIIANADAYRGVIAVLTGLRRRGIGEIAAADSPEAVAAVMQAIGAQLALVSAPG
ncbi:MAG TPA: hypothetical protein VGA75_02630 [Paracoccaceae bacterium]